MNNFHRPCTLWGQTFDAYGACNFTLGGLPETVIEGNSPRSLADLYFTLARDLNTPVRATKEVLAGLLPYEHHFDVVHILDPQLPDELCKNGSAWYSHNSNRWLYNNLSDDDVDMALVEGNYVQATNTEALHYLLQFTTEGIRMTEQMRTEESGEEC